MVKNALVARTARAGKVAKVLKGKAKVAKVVAPVSEFERVRVALRMNHGMRSQILQHMIETGAGVYTVESLRKVKALAWIGDTTGGVANYAACMSHIAWKMQVKACGYRLALDGTGEGTKAKLTRLARKVTKSKAKAIAAPAEGGEAA